MTAPVLLHGGLTTHRRGRILREALSAEATTTLPESGAVLVAFADGFQAADESEQARLVEWTRAAGHVLLLVPPFAAGTCERPVPWRAERLEGGPRGGEGLAKILAGEVTHRLEGKLQTPPLPGATWSDLSVCVGTYRLHPAAGLFAITCLPLWSLAVRTDLKGAPGAAQALTPAINRALAAQDASPVRRVEMVRIGQEQLLEAADSFAKGRADRLRLAFRMAGLSPSSFVDRGSSLGGPLIDSKDPRALAAVLDVDDDFAVRIQRAARDLNESKQLAQAAEDLPVARPTNAGSQTSGFGVRFDPFTRRPAYHSGLDFNGGYAQPIYSTGPGVVSFTGQRSGYGNVVEIDHGRGLKTRYAHLSGFAVRPGQRVAVGQRIAAMGSTGRSTGTHLHYEVWVNGRAQNPGRFLKAGQYVLQAD